MICEISKPDSNGKMRFDNANLRTYTPYILVVDTRVVVPQFYELGQNYLANESKSQRKLRFYERNYEILCMVETKQN